ncbi:MAG: enhanced serine sensitivity protein SseB C-terminal domain-containing protein [Oscillospiraceae bacterium]|nr:enhanced serine sensitivity protein SseB C-terminal domain-containing protein [Oscillospiraceae bacterium]
MVNEGYTSLIEILTAASTGRCPEDKFLNAVMSETVYVICTPAGKEKGLLHDGILEIFAQPSEKGLPVVPFFTKEKLLHEYAKTKVTFEKVNCLELFQMINGASAVMNPGTSDKKFSSKTIAKLILESKQALKPWEIPFDTSKDVEYGRPTRTPETLKKVLIPFFQKKDNVRKAFFIGMKRKGENEKVIVVVDFDGSHYNLFSEMVKLVSKQFDCSDLLFISYENEAVKKIADSHSAFYSRATKSRADKMDF